MQTHKPAQREHKKSAPQDQGSTGFIPQAEPGDLIQKAQRDAATLSPAEIIQLQRTIGNQAAQRLIQRAQPINAPRSTPKKAADPAISTDADAEAVQRAMGMELEVPYVYAWQPTLLWGQAKAMANAGRRKRFAKGVPLVSGNGFELQGEDAPGGGNLSNIEFVTKAFNDDMAGFLQLGAAMTEIEDMVRAMGNHAVNGQFLDINDLPGNIQKPKAFLQDAHKPIKAKIQTTFGLDLAKVAQFMEEVFATDRNGGARLQQGRAELTGFDTNLIQQNPGPILRTIGGAPANADTAITAMRAAFLNTPAPTPKLKSLLAMVIAYLKIGAGNNGAPIVRSYAKTIAPVMARTDFAAMFAMLSDAEKRFYSPNNGAAWKLLVQKAPGLNDLTLPVFASGIRVDRGNGIDRSLDALTRELWVSGMASGTEYLSQYNFPDQNQRSEIEGLGGYKGKTDTLAAAGGNKGAIFELRAMTKAIDPNVNMPMNERGLYAANEWSGLASRIFMYIFSLNHGDDLRYGE